MILSVMMDYGDDEVIVVIPIHFCWFRRVQWVDRTL